MIARALLVLLAAGLLAGGAAAEGTLTASVASPIVDTGGMLAVTVRCAGTPNVDACAGKLVLPQLGAGATTFSGVAAGTSKRLQVDFPGELNTTVAKLSSLTVELTQVVGGAEQTVTSTVALKHEPSSSGGGGGGGGQPPRAPGAQGREAPTIAVGPATRYTAIHDPRGDARSNFQLPQLFDIVLATAKRQGDAVVLTVVSTSAITKHDGYGNPVAPCVEIPWASTQQYPMILFGNGQLSGYTQHVWPKMRTSIHGGTISWTVPRTVLAKKGFTKGFLWRATGVCDAHYRADFAPNKGFATFRWVKVG